MSDDTLIISKERKRRWAENRRWREFIFLGFFVYALVDSAVDDELWQTAVYGIIVGIVLMMTIESFIEWRYGA